MRFLSLLCRLRLQKVRNLDKRRVHHQSVSLFVLQISINFRLCSGDHGYFGGMLGSKIFIEEAYDGLTVAKNIKEEYDFEHIMNELKIAYHLTNPKHTDGKAKRPSLQPLLAREITAGVATRRIDYKRFLETLSYPK